jgi:hypothetical protein
MIRDAPLANATAAGRESAKHVDDGYRSRRSRSALDEALAHLAAAAYPILEGRGELLSSRLKQD